MWHERWGVNGGAECSCGLGRRRRLRREREKAFMENLIPSHARVGRARFLLAPTVRCLARPEATFSSVDVPSAQNGGDTMRYDVSESNTDRIAVPRASISTLQAYFFHGRRRG